MAVPYLKTQFLRYFLECETGHFFAYLKFNLWIKIFVHALHVQFKFNPDILGLNPTDYDMVASF